MPADFLTRNMFFREAEQDTPAQGLSGAGYTGNPQQLLSMLQSPEMQQQLAHFGIHFDPRQVQQSPFFPNSFMGAHPGLGGRLSAGMANMAATPEAPLVSGAGSGLSRATQGMIGGPELLRQYQIRQLMAPLQGVGMQMPMLGEQRRQQLLQALMEDMRNRQGQSDEHERNLLEIQKGKQGLEQQKLEEQRGYPTPYGIMTPMPQGQIETQQPAGMPSFLGGQVSQGQPQLPQVSQALPGGHWAFTPYNQQMIAGQAAAKETPATTNLKGAQADQARGRGQEARAKAGLAGAKTKTESGKRDIEQSKMDRWSQDRLNKIEQDAQNKINVVDADGKMDPATKEQIKANIRANAEVQKKNVGQGYQTGTQHLGGQIQENAAPRGAKAGKPQQQPNAEINSHPEMKGKPAGQYKDTKTNQTFYWDGRQVAQQPQGAPQ